MNFINKNRKVLLGGGVFLFVLIITGSLIAISTLGNQASNPLFEAPKGYYEINTKEQLLPSQNQAIASIAQDTSLTFNERVSLNDHVFRKSISTTIPEAIYATGILNTDPFGLRISLYTACSQTTPSLGIAVFTNILPPELIVYPYAYTLSIYKLKVVTGFQAPIYSLVGWFTSKYWGTGIFSKAIAPFSGDPILDLLTKFNGWDGTLIRGETYKILGVSYQTSILSETFYNGTIGNSEVNILDCITGAPVTPIVTPTSIVVTPTPIPTQTPTPIPTQTPTPTTIPTAPATTVPVVTSTPSISITPTAIIPTLPSSFTVTASMFKATCNNGSISLNFSYRTSALPGDATPTPNAFRLVIGRERPFSIEEEYLIAAELISNRWESMFGTLTIAPRTPYDGIYGLFLMNGWIGTFTTGDKYKLLYMEYPDNNGRIITATIEGPDIVTIPSCGGTTSPTPTPLITPTTGYINIVQPTQAPALQPATETGLFGISLPVGVGYIAQAFIGSQLSCPTPIQKTLDFRSGSTMESLLEDFSLFTNRDTSDGAYFANLEPSPYTQEVRFSLAAKNNKETSIMIAPRIPTGNLNQLKDITMKVYLSAVSVPGIKYQFKDGEVTPDFSVSLSSKYLSPNTNQSGVSLVQKTELSSKEINRTPLSSKFLTRLSNPHDTVETELETFGEVKGVQEEPEQTTLEYPYRTVLTYRLQTDGQRKTVTLTASRMKIGGNNGGIVEEILNTTSYTAAFDTHVPKLILHRAAGDLFGENFASVGISKIVLETTPNCN